MNMYKNRFAVAIKHNGKILREQKDLVLLPFGSEFTVLVKNLNSRRAKFTLHIDGTDVLDGTEIIVNANSEVELKRFIRNGNMTEGNAFKFIERTAAIEDGPRGIKVDDGVVRVEYWFEQEAPTYTKTIHTTEHWHQYPYRKSYWDAPYSLPMGGPYYSSNTTSTNAAGDMIQSASLGGAVPKATKGIMRGMSANATGGATLQSSNAVFTNSVAASTPTMDSNAVHDANEAGITVPGSKVSQSFQTVYGFNSETKSEVIILRMAGVVGAIEVAAPVTVKTKNICSTCNHTNKATAKFCSQCGTSLNLV